MALEELIKWIQKHFDRVDRVIYVNDNLSFKNNYDKGNEPQQRLIFFVI